jgi:hypothetical protein
MLSAPRVVRSLGLLMALSACALPEEGFETGTAPPPPAAAPGQWIIGDARVGATQLHRTGDEASLPVLRLGDPGTLTLAFDLLGRETGDILDVTFLHTDRRGRETLLPSEYLTGFERDDLLDYERSGTAVGAPYVHYRYAFPNATIGFEISGNYRVRVTTRDGALLFEAPFYVTEELADVEFAFGSVLRGGSVASSIQPAARLRTDPRLAEFDASQFTVCFARNGLTDGIRCAPEPSLIDLSLYQFYLPRDQAFPQLPPLFEVDLGLLALNNEVVDVDRAARPPTATLDLDYAEFGGDVRDAVLASTPLISAVYRDVGRADVDAQYVDVTFRYVPPTGRTGGRRVHVRGSFNGWRATPQSEMSWVAEEGRYEATLRIKQGRYVYGYSPVSDRAGVLGQPTLFTAFVYLADPRRFTDRLVAVRSGVAR